MQRLSKPFLDQFNSNHQQVLFPSLVQYSTWLEYFPFILPYHTIFLHNHNSFQHNILSNNNPQVSLKPQDDYVLLLFRYNKNCFIDFFMCQYLFNRTDPWSNLLQDLIDLSIKPNDRVLPILSLVSSHQASMLKMFLCTPFCSLFHLLQCPTDSRLLPYQYSEKHRCRFNNIFLNLERPLGIWVTLLSSGTWYLFTCFNSLRLT